MVLRVSAVVTCTTSPTQGPQPNWFEPSTFIFSVIFGGLSSHESNVIRDVYLDLDSVWRNPVKRRPGIPYSPILCPPVLPEDGDASGAPAPLFNP